MSGVCPLALPAFGCWNIHASLLPRWRGAAPIQRAIEAVYAEGTRLTRDVGGQAQRAPLSSLAAAGVLVADLLSDGGAGLDTLASRCVELIADEFSASELLVPHDRFGCSAFGGKAVFQPGQRRGWCILA